jgi:hypothetical protein
MLEIIEIVLVNIMVLKTGPDRRFNRFNRGPVPNPVRFFEKTGKMKNRSKTENRRFDRQNREPERLNRFWPGSPKSKTTPFCKKKFPLPLALTEVAFHFFPLPLCHTSPLCLTPLLAPSASRRRCLLQTALSLSVTPSLSRSFRLCLGHSVSVLVSPLCLGHSVSVWVTPSLSRSLRLCLGLSKSVSVSHGLASHRCLSLSLSRYHMIFI